MDHEVPAINRWQVIKMRDEMMRAQPWSATDLLCHALEDVENTQIVLAFYRFLEFVAETV